MPSDVPSEPGVIEVIVGAPGKALGVPETAGDAVPAPDELTARISTGYVVPSVRPLTTIGDVVTPLDVHVAPSSTEYS
jgi:hypothetical protein